MISTLCCCCPPPVQGLLNLYIRSGCSKSTVAAALTYFPPSPAMYKFERLDKNMQVLPAEDDEIQDYEEDFENMDEDDGSEVDLNQNGNSRSVQKANEMEKEENPMSRLVEKNKKLKKRADRLYERDLKDAANGVTYKFVPDDRFRVAPFFAGRIESIKIHSPKSKSFIAALIYHVVSDTSNQDEMNGKPVRTIIYSHGNATDIGAMNLIQCIMARNLGANILMYDYSGYGESGGMTRECNTYYDIEAVYTYAVEHLAKGCPENIILYGQSVGSGPVCYLGAKKPSGGIILHSPFMSGMRVLTSSRALACLDIYPNIDRIKRIKCPIFIIHGLRDEEVSAHHGIGLYEAVREEFRYEPWWIPDRGHNDICEGAGKMNEYIKRLKNFLDALDELATIEGNLERGKVKLMRR